MERPVHLNITCLLTLLLDEDQEVAGSPNAKGAVVWCFPQLCLHNTHGDRFDSKQKGKTNHVKDSPFIKH